MKSHFLVFDSVIPRNVRLSEAPSHGKPALLYDVQSKGAQGYLSLARELLSRESSARRPAARERRDDHGRHRSAARWVAGSTRSCRVAVARGDLRRQERLQLPAREDRRRRRGSRGSTSTRRSSRSWRRVDPRARAGRAAGRATRRPAPTGSSSSRASGGGAPPEAGLREALVVVKDVSAKDAFELALIENVQREDLNPIELAEAFDRLVREHGYTQEALAERLGKDRTTITNGLRLLKLPPRVRAKLMAGELSEGHARALLGAGDAALIEQLAEKVLARQAERPRDRGARARARAAKPAKKDGPRRRRARAPACATSRPA